MVEKTEAEKKAFGEKMKAARAAAKAKREAEGKEPNEAAEEADAMIVVATDEANEKVIEHNRDLQAEADAATMKQQADALTDGLARAAEVDNAIQAAEAHTKAFDPRGIYVVVQSAIGRQRGALGVFREPAVYGDLIGAKEVPGVVLGLEFPDIINPQDMKNVIMPASNGVAELRDLWEKGHILDQTHPLAQEARRLRIQANAAKTQAGPAALPLGDLRLFVVANGGSVIGYAQGVKVG